MKKIISLILMLAMMSSLAALVSCGESENSGKNNINKTDKYLLLVNKENELGADFVPDDLVDIEKISDILLESDFVFHLGDHYDDMRNLYPWLGARLHCLKFCQQ